MILLDDVALIEAAGIFPFAIICEVAVFVQPFIASVTVTEYIFA